MRCLIVIAMAIMIIGVCAIDLDHSSERRRVGAASKAPIKSPPAKAAVKTNAKASAKQGTADPKAIAKSALTVNAKTHSAAKKQDVKVVTAAVPKSAGGNGKIATVVRLTKEEFEKTLGPIGTSLKSVFDSIKSAASAVWDDIKGLFRFRKEQKKKATTAAPTAPPAPKITCRFVGAVPGVNDIVLDPPGGGSDAVIGSEDPGQYKAMSGPAMNHNLMVHRNNVNCFADNFAKTVTKQGSARWDIGFVCVDDQNRKVDKPDTCKVTVVGEGLYKGYAYTTANSDWCTGESFIPFAKENKVSFGCNEEVQFDVGAKTIFAKAARFQRGNSITTTRESSIEIKAGADSDGLAADVGVKFGKTTSESQSFDPAETYVLGTGRSEATELNNAVPSITMQLTTQATAFTNSESRVWGTAIASTTVGGMWYYGHATGGCGDQQSVSGYDYWIYGATQEVEAAANQAKSFLRSNGINL